jgi:site-specific recombinase XerD
VEAWLLTAHRKGLASSTINHLLSVMHRFFGFLHERGLVTQQPIHWRRHHVIVPQSFPKPIGEDDLIQLFRVIDRLRDRTMFLLMLRCGLWVGEVSALTWLSINFKAGSIRIDNSKGQVDRVVYFALDADKALHQWRHTQPFEATDCFSKPPPARHAAKRPRHPASDGQVSQRGRHHEALFAARQSLRHPPP